MGWPQRRGSAGDGWVVKVKGRVRGGGSGVKSYVCVRVYVVACTILVVVKGGKEDKEWEREED